MDISSIVLTGDTFWENIINHLSQLDLYNLSQTCKYYNDKLNLKTNVIKEINSRLLELFGDDYDTFKNILKKTKGVISGSFIIQSILKTYWNDTDIDIYIPIKNNVLTKIDSTGSMKSEMEDFLYSNMDFWGGTETSDYKDSFEGNIYFVRTYKKNNTKYAVQVMLIDTDVEGIHNFIKNDFDFDICKNAYWNYAFKKRALV